MYVKTLSPGAKPRFPLSHGCQWLSPQRGQVSVAPMELGLMSLCPWAIAVQGSWHRLLFSVLIRSFCAMAFWDLKTLLSLPCAPALPMCSHDGC